MAMGCLGIILLPCSIPVLIAGVSSGSFIVIYIGLSMLVLSFFWIIKGFFGSK